MNKIFKKIWMTVAVLIILMAVFSSIFRSLTPWAKQYKGDVEHHLTLLLGQPVTIQTMETGWYWFQPVLKLNQVTLGEDAQKSFHLSKLLVGINLLKSLWNWQILPGVLYIDDMHLAFREKKGHWTIDGISADALSTEEMTPEKSKQLLGWLSQQERLIIKHISAYFYFDDGGLIPVSGLNVSILNNGGRYKLKGSARLDQTSSTDFQLLGDGYFDLEHFADIDGKFYFAAKNIIPAQWQSLFPKATEHFEGGRGGIELWLDMHKGTVGSIQAQVQVENLAWRLLNSQHSQLVQLFTANLSWKPDSSGWELHGDQINLRVGGLNWPENQFLLKHNKEQQTYQLFVKNIIIESLLATAFDWPKSIKHLLELKPQGILQDSQIQIQVNGGGFMIPSVPLLPSAGKVAISSVSSEQVSWMHNNEIIYVLTRFEQLGWNAQSTLNIPEVKNLTGVIHWQPDEGRLELESEDTTIAIPSYPKQKLTLLNGAFDWKELNDGLRISIDRFVVNKADMTLSVQGVLDQVTRNSAGNIRLGAEFSGKNIEQWMAFLPKKKLKPKLYSWLTKDLKHIGSLSGKLTLNGLADDFPFDNNKGAFLINAHASDADLYINSKWKIIKDLEANLHVKNRNFNVDIINADLQGVPVKQMNLRIDDIGHDKESLVIAGSVHGSLQKMIYYVIASPLKNKLALLQQLTTKGAAALNLKLEIPLYPENDTLLAKGDLTFKNNAMEVRYDAMKFNLEHINGQLFFDQEGVNESTLSATTLGHPLAIRIQSVKNPKPATTITIDSEWTAESLKNQLNMPLFSIPQGSFPIHVVLSLANKESDADTITLNSSLINVRAKQLSKKDWAFNLQQKNINADLVYHIPTNKISGAIHRLHLEQFASEAGSIDADTAPKKRPEEIPNLDLRIDDFSVGALSIGAVTLQSTTKPQRWILDKCRIVTPEYQFTLQGDWTQNKEINKTKLHVQFETNNLNKTLQLWDINPVVDAKKGYVEFQGGWNDSIYNFSRASLNGSLFVQLKNGRITHLSEETEEKLGLGKLLSILSLQTIPRRLQLDFSDLAHQGYSFDIFQGNFTINKGIMNTQDSYLDGPVAYASMKGDLDLVKRIYNLNLKISPHITASLPIVATIAGGPVAGVATWVATKIINQGMQKISAYSYKVSGPWSQPVVQQLNIIKNKTENGMPAGRGAIKVQPNID